MNDPTPQDRLGRITKLHGLRWCSYDGWEHSSHVRKLSGNAEAYTTDLSEMPIPVDANDYLKNLSTDEIDPGELYFTPPHFGGSDYSGAISTKANANCILKDYKGKDIVWAIYGACGSWNVVFGLSALLQCSEETFVEVLETLEAMEDYPVIDGDAICEIESEVTEEAWNSRVRDDFTSRLERKYSDFDFVWPADDVLRELFETCAEKADEYWENEEGLNMYINTEQVAERCAWERIVSYSHAK